MAKLFQFAQQCNQIIGIYPYPQTQRYLTTNSTRAIILISGAQLFFTTAAFFVFEANSMFDYGFSFSMAIATANGIAVYIIFIWRSENTSKLIENCEGFIEKRDSTVAYGEIIGIIERFNQFLFYAMAITDALLYFAMPPYTLLRYCVFNMGESSYFLFYPCWYPFDWRTPSGYLVAWLAQGVGLTAMASAYLQFPNLVFGSCWLFIFIVEDITKDLIAFNTIIGTTSNGKHTTERFCEIVQIHSDAKQRVGELNQTIEYSLFAFFLWTLLGLAGILVTLQFHLWADDWNLLEIVVLMLVLFWTTTYIFLLCEPGTRMINQFDVFSDELSRCDWYLLSVELQRMYVIFLSDTQKPKKMTSYANITCERDTLKRIVNTAFSYLMTFRRFRV